MTIGILLIVARANFMNAIDHNCLSWIGSCLKTKHFIIHLELFDMLILSLPLNLIIIGEAIKLGWVWIHIYNTLR